MELKMKEMQLPEKVSFNYEELKQAVAEKASFYANLVFTDEQLPEAKKTRADLNKLKKALNDERLKREKEYMKPFNEFKAQINEIISLIDEPVKLIDSQIKGFEEQQKEEKLEKIKEFWESTEHPEWLQCKYIFDISWLNKSFSMKKVQEAITARLEQIASDLKTLEALPEFSFEAVEMYKQTLDINMAISEGKRLADIQKRKATKEAERQQIQQEIRERLGASKEAPAPTVSAAIESIEREAFETVQPDKTWLRFKVLMSVEEALALKEFFESRNITFGAI